MSNLVRHVRPYIPLLLAMIALTFGQTWSSLELPDYMARIINRGIVGQNTHLVYRTGLIMLAVALFGGVCMIGVGYLAARVATGVTRRMREDLFATVENFSLHEFNQFSTASLITRCTNDMQQIQMVFGMTLRMSLMAPFLGVGAIIKAYGLAPSMTWIMALAIGILVVIIATIFAIAIPQFTRLQGLVDRLNLVTREILVGLRVIRAFSRERHELAKFGAANTNLTDINLLVNRLTSLMQPAMLLILNVTSVAIVWVGAHKIETGALQIGDMLAFMQYATQAIFAFLMISFIFIMAPRAVVSAKRVAEVIATQPSVLDPVSPARPGTRGGTVEFRDVTFTYPEAETPVLDRISFTARSGQTTAIVGSTGSGKSTLVNLIPRFYDATAGQVLVDGVDVRDYTQADLRARIGYVSQKAILFSGTVESNIGYGANDASTPVIRQAARTAQAAEFIDELDGTYGAAIAQGGANVSGGQKQRLAIARALARRPEIYIFDDSFSALDFKTDAMLRAALRAETADKTVLIVAQRIGTIMNADSIIVLDEGRIVGQGRHDELLRTCPVYREIAASQLSDDDLARVDGARDRAAAPAGRTVD
jgi:ATP-binding cassette subfamily B multidrug efflux pump